MTQTNPEIAGSTRFFSSLLGSQTYPVSLRSSLGPPGRSVRSASPASFPPPTPIRISRIDPSGSCGTFPHRAGIEVHHEIVSKPRQVRLSLTCRSDLLLEPEIKNVMQVDIG